MPSAYHTEKKRLNTAQRQAVETIYGPVLALAGPGTGKTQVLALRIAEILEKTDTLPQNILALTFTEAGVTAMRNRLRTMIGTAAHSVQISTFHGFCSTLLGRFPEKFLFAKSLTTADDLVKIQIIQDILQNNSFSALSPFASPMYFLREILGKISLLKRENISPEDFEKIVVGHEERFDAIADEEKRNPKTKKIKGKYISEKKNITKWKELSRIYAEYQKQLTKKGLMDFDDQILFVVTALEEDDEFRSCVQEEILFLLADEFQDSNGSQLALLDLITQHQDIPNIFVVGDDDQSIYRFQGANMENILHFLQQFPDALHISLTENYRSTEQILRLAEQSLTASTERLTMHIPSLNKNLTSPLNSSGDVPSVLSFETGDAEQFFVLKKIQELEKNGTPLREIAILVRTNREGQELLQYCTQNSLPAVFFAKSNVLDDIRVRQLLTLLKGIADPGDNALFFEILHFPVWNISPIEIWESWQIARKQKGRYIDSVLSDADLETTDKTHNIAQKILQWNQDMHSFSFAIFFQKILTESGFLEFLLQEKTRLETLNHVNSLFSEVKNLSRGNPDFHLQNFLEMIALREEFGVPILDTPLQSSSNVVTICTTHGAKGLEYDVVFVINLINGVWGDRRNMDKIALPTDILSLPPSTESANEEERRLFFVAITRARTHLFLSTSRTSLSGKKQSPSRFLDEVQEDSSLLQEVPTESYENAVFERLKADLLFPKHISSHSEEVFLRDMVQSESFSLSPTVFENYRECPRKFLYENLLRIPRAKNLSASLGTALHFALEVYFDQYKKTGILPDITVARSGFAHALGKESLTENEQESGLRTGNELLEGYFSQYQSGFMVPVATELDFRSHHVVLGDVRLTGKIDKIEHLQESQNTVRIIDYKTTTPKSANAIKGTLPSQATSIRNGSMYRQLQFYFLLASRSVRFSYIPEEFALDFLKPSASGKFSSVSLGISESDTISLQEEIFAVWKSIQNLEFLQQTSPCHIAQENKGECWYCSLKQQV